MAKQSFSASIAAFAEKVEGAKEAIFKESAQAVVEEMQTPGWSVASTNHSISQGLGASGRGKNRKQVQGAVAAEGAGGNLPVDTGFLRASLMASVSAMPTIDPGKVPAEGKSYDWSESDIEAVTNGAQLGQTLFFGYTAAYARVAEYGDENRMPRRFVALAAMRWQTIVEATAQELKGRLGLK